VCDELDLDFQAVKSWDRQYNDLYADLGMEQFSRYILDPPQGEIGGHCVVPNAVILNKQFPSPLVEEVTCQQ